jgi:hypothetical protein
MNLIIFKLIKIIKNNVPQAGDKVDDQDKKKDEDDDNEY